MTIEQAKDDLLATLESMDKNKLSLPDLQMYTQILKTVSEIQTKSYTECLVETMSACSGIGYKPTMVSDLQQGGRRIEP